MQEASPRPPNTPAARRHLFSRLVSLLLLTTVSHAAPSDPAFEVERIEVFPERIELLDRRDQRHLVVTGYGRIRAASQDSAPLVRDLTRLARFVSGDDHVAGVRGHVVIPRGDGRTMLRVLAGGHELQVPVVVTGQNRPRPVSFHYETLPALSRKGCSSGACHGSPSGKGGFRLSLRAFEPTLDQRTLVREYGARRTNSTSPDESLILLKALGKIPHGGGVRLRAGEPIHGILRDWISEGCQADLDRAPECVGLEVHPPSGRSLRRPALSQQLSVLARFSDGSRRDVTHLAAYSSSDETVATVSPEGLVAGHERGEAAIIVRYLEHIEETCLTFIEGLESFTWNDPPENNYVDRLVHRKLRRLGYLPSPTCTDEEFVRRVYLDVIGVLPTIDETRSFLDDGSPDKRASLIGALLDRPEYASFWALKWGDLLRLTKAQLGEKGARQYHAWLRHAMATDMPYDELARRLLTASGSTFTHPPANYYRSFSSAEDTMESVAQVFLGSRIQCAKCHNHPFERWTQADYQGLTSFFARVRTKKTPRTGETIVWTASSGEVNDDRTGRPVRPWVPVQGEVDVPAGEDRRGAFVRWLVRRDNPFFARVEVNRIWAHVMGRGIVEPFDDFRDTNPPANAELLDELARDFVEHGFDRRHILRTILASRTYQASARAIPLNAGDTRYFSHYRPRMLDAEQLVEAVCHVTGVPESFEQLPRGTRATQAPSPDLLGDGPAHLFLKVFGQPERQTACECERSSDVRLGQALQLINGDFVHQKLRHPRSRVLQLMRAGAGDAAIVEALYLAAYCRSPEEGEMNTTLGYVRRRGGEDRDGRARAFEDLAWTLINSSEFLFQH